MANSAPSRNGRYCVLDLSRADHEPEPLPTWRGKLLGTYRKFSSARALAAHQLRDGNVFVVVVDALDGRRVFPDQGRDKDEDQPAPESKRSRTTVPARAAARRPSHERTVRSTARRS